MPASPLRFRKLAPGDPAPWFTQRASSNDRYHFGTVAGRYLVLAFFASSTRSAFSEVRRLIESARALFNDTHLAFFGISADAADEERLKASLPGIRYVWDGDGTVSRLYGSLPLDPAPAEARRDLWFVLDPALRIRAVTGITSGSANELGALLRHLPPVAEHAGVEVPAPVLYLPGVLEPELCAELVQIYTRGGGEDSGFMRQVDGRTVLVVDHAHKRRMDHVITDAGVRERLWQRFERRVFPEIKKAYQFDVTRMERFLVACYEAEQRGHFQPHRDNTTSGTAHRRFAVTVNLNDGFSGGDLHFPEFSPRRYRPPIGGAVVFSCSLLHAVDAVTQGRRFAFLPFLYDESAARVRASNNAFLSAEVAPYQYTAREADGASSGVPDGAAVAASP